VTWGVIGTLPTGLSLDTATGEIFGTPTVAGSYAFTITLTDGFGNSDSAALAITVN
jgi:hypothetical protein